MYAPIGQLVEQIPLKDKVAGSRPAGRTAEVAKLVDAPVLGTGSVRNGGSNPLLGTIEEIASFEGSPPPPLRLLFFFFFLGRKKYEIFLKVCIIIRVNS